MVNGEKRIYKTSKPNSFLYKQYFKAMPTNGSLVFRDGFELQADGTIINPA